MCKKCRFKIITDTTQTLIVTNNVRDLQGMTPGQLNLKGQSSRSYICACFFRYKRIVLDTTIISFTL